MPQIRVTGTREKVGHKVRADRSFIHDGKLIPARREEFIIKAASSIMGTYESLSSLDGRIAIDPIVRAWSIPTHVYYELDCAFTDQNRGLIYRVEGINLDAFHNNIQIGLNMALDLWVRGEHNVGVVITDHSVTNGQPGG